MESKVKYGYREVLGWNCNFIFGSFYFKEPFKEENFLKLKLPGPDVVFIGEEDAENVFTGGFLEGMPFFKKKRIGRQHKKTGGSA